MSEPTDRSQRIIEALMSAKALLAVAVLFVIYATTIPFQFDRAPTLSDADFVPFWDMDRGRLHSIPDLVQNVIFFVPVGFFALLGVDSIRRMRRSRAIIIVSVFGFLLSLFVESLQTMSVFRRSSASDLATNAIGAGIGAVVAWYYADRYEVRIKRLIRDAGKTHPGLIIVAFFCIQVVFLMWAPFIPTLDIGMLRSQAKVLYYQPWGDKALVSLVTDGLVFGALAFSVAKELPGFLAKRNRLPLDPGLMAGPVGAAIAGGLVATIALALELGQVPLVHHTPGLKDLTVNVVASLAGAGIALAYEHGALEPARSIGETTRTLPWLVLGFAIVTPTIRALAPFTLEPLSTALATIEWQDFLPFWSFFRRITPATFINVFEAALMYVCLGYALRVLGRSLLLSFGLALVLAETLEILQIPVVGRTFDFTEGVLAAGGALIGAWAHDHIVGSGPQVSKK